MMIIFFAQQSAQDASVQILWILGLVVLLAIVLGLVAWIVRKVTLGADAEPTPPGLTLADLRQMHREGQMTDEEFEAAKRLVVAQGLSMMSDAEEDRELLGDSLDVSDAAGGEDGDNFSPDSDKNDDDDATPRSL